MPSTAYLRIMLCVCLSLIVQLPHYIIFALLETTKQRRKKHAQNSSCNYMIGRQSRIVYSLCQLANKEATTTTITTSTWLRDEQYTTSVFFCAAAAIHHQIIHTTDGESKRIRCAVRSPARIPLSLFRHAVPFGLDTIGRRTTPRAPCAALYTTVCRCLLLRWLMVRRERSTTRNGKQRATCFSPPCNYYSRNPFPVRQ